jgi:predicted negative regulator of RcsB-dependent stress response
MMAKLRGDYAAALGPFEEALELFQSVGDEWNAAVQLDMAGLVLANKGDFIEARASIR